MLSRGFAESTAVVNRYTSGSDMTGQDRLEVRRGIRSECGQA